ncbi:pyrroloquinoline quinone biosynthesis peptide chaperone PqqD [Paracoccus sulfuroxidans]|uniref:Pyrroloquinoline quinone biosynthesis protein D n=1 Tax=Paracoccus sulfuroxidans TaxID=384678 RepID=A0A562NP39_9RHOB|nr:pyrroloquinoline quinone biosynthesis peptide chaperone PqqD [Paracoccus sulfuroxidans]TWI33840.1 pyrroloquinoline quinone biosynthesis protein D [Paracoccus sulfuroxidans]
MTAPSLPDDCVPYLPRGVRLHDDKVRGIRVLLAPERAISLDPVGDAILSELDGARTLGDLIAELAARYQAPAEQVGQDMREFLTGLIDRRMVFLRESGARGA